MITSWGSKAPLCFEVLRSIFENQRELWMFEHWKVELSLFFFFLFFLIEIFCEATFKKDLILFVLWGSVKEIKGAVELAVTDYTLLWLVLLSNQRSFFFFFLFSNPSHFLGFSCIYLFLLLFQSPSVLWIRIQTSCVISVYQLDLRLTQTMSDWPSGKKNCGSHRITPTIAMVPFSRRNWFGLFVMAEFWSVSSGRAEAVKWLRCSAGFFVSFSIRFSLTGFINSD